MALQLSKDDVFGNNHATCYVYIKRVDMDFENDTAQAELEFYIDAAAKSAGKAPFLRGIYDIPLDTGLKASINGQTQSQLLLLAEFATATEV